MGRLGRALERNRIVTVVGLGGMGKSRLVDEFVHRRVLAGDTVLRAALASAHDLTRVDRFVADALGLYVDEEAAPIAVLVAAIGATPTLLVLDGVEHAATEIGNLALTLIERCPRLRVVTTSRIPLGIGAERTVGLGPLAVPEDDTGVAGTALQLMFDRAGIDEESLDDAAAARMRATCAATGGVPLLIELAARTFEVDDRSVAPAASGGGSHTDVVRAAIEQALDSVDESARRMLSFVAWLPGGVSEETAAVLAPEPAGSARRALRQLSWTHLLTARAGLASLRFVGLDPIREATLDAQDEDERERVVRAAAAAVQGTFASLRHDYREPVDVTRLDACADDYDNLRSLLAQRLVTAPGRALEMAIAASEFWPIRGRVVEGRRWIQDAIVAARPSGEAEWRAVVALGVHHPHVRRDCAAPGGAGAHRGRDGAAVPRVAAVGVGADVHRDRAGWQGDRAGAARALDQAEVIERRVGSPWTSATLDTCAGSTAPSGATRSERGRCNAPTRSGWSSSATRSPPRWAGISRRRSATWRGATTCWTTSSARGSWRRSTRTSRC